MRRILAASLLTLLLAGCQAAAPTTPPSAATPSAAPTRPIVSPSPTVPSPLPDITPTPQGTAAAFAEWRRDDLPDPTSEPFRRGTPSDVIWFKDRYIAVGATGECCADSDPSASQGRVWTSRDGESWRLLDRHPTFKHASLWRLTTDGDRLLVAGWYADPIPGELPVGVPAVWVSLDGRTWTRAAEPAPSHVAVGRGGFVGARVVDDAGGVSTRFMFSTDGLAWSHVSEAIELELRGLASDPNGNAVAVGMPLRDGVHDGQAVAYRSSDGRAWDGQSTLTTDGFATALSASEDGFYAVGWQTLTGPGAAELDFEMIWHSMDGVHWTALPLVVGEEESLDELYVAEDAIVVTGTTSVDGRSNAMVWVSTDAGRSWGRVPDQRAFEGVNNLISAIIDTPTGLLAIGSRIDQESVDVKPVVWRASR